MKFLFGINFLFVSLTVYGQSLVQELTDLSGAYPESVRNLAFKSLENQQNEAKREQKVQDQKIWTIISLGVLSLRHLSSF